MSKKILVVVSFVLIIVSCQSNKSQLSREPLYVIDYDSLYDYKNSYLSMDIPEWVTSSESDLRDLYPNEKVFFFLEEGKDLVILENSSKMLDMSNNLLFPNASVPTNIAGLKRQVNFWLAYKKPDESDLFYHYFTLCTIDEKIWENLK